MISLSELLSNQCTFDELNDAQKGNIMILLDRINQVRMLWNRPMVVTSGFRTMEHHLAIYKAKGITDPKRIPMQSRHLYAQAADISDPKRELQKWCMANESELVRIGLWMESFSFTKTWCHFQIVPPLSGRRFFMP